jgi:hypothetical protein
VHEGSIVVGLVGVEEGVTADLNKSPLEWPKMSVLNWLYFLDLVPTRGSFAIMLGVDVGDFVVDTVGLGVGAFDWDAVGEAVGPGVGALDGAAVGEAVGLGVGALDGAAIGEAVLGFGHGPRHTETTAYPASAPVFIFTTFAVTIKSFVPSHFSNTYCSSCFKVALNHDCENHSPFSPASTTVTSSLACLLSRFIPVARLNAINWSVPVLVSILTITGLFWGLFW